MADENKSPDPAQATAYTIETVRAEVPTIYVNNATFGMTEFDIHIELSEIQGANPDEKKVLISPRARAVMSYPFALRFLSTLSKFLDAYGKTKKEQEELLRKAAESQPDKPEEKKS
jgi:hypothetical protein